METQITPRKRVLLVEDETPVRAVVKALLEKRGYFVTEANNGAEALTTFAKSKFDLVITDYALPFMTGDQLAGTIKTLAPQQPVIMITGYPKYPSPENPVDGVVFKPFGSAELAQLIQSVLSGAELADIA
jgi:CheY-like chemotaxis protein